jgi:uncharacterized membrane protein
MSHATPPPQTADDSPMPTESDAARRGHFPLFAAIRRRVVSGLIFALPVAITFWVVYWLYSTLQNLVLDPGARLIKRAIVRAGLDNLPWWWTEYVSPLIALALAVILLYFLGYFGRTRIYRAIDWLLLRLPIVSVIFKAVRNVFDSLGDQRGGAKFKRVVLVPFPSREVQSPAFVTRVMTDVATGRTVLCVYIPYAPLPTTGLILVVPDEEVTELNWDVHETMQSVISFGISTPSTITFHPRADAAAASPAPLGGGAEP